MPHHRGIFEKAQSHSNSKITVNQQIIPEYSLILHCDYGKMKKSIHRNKTA